MPYQPILATLGYLLSPDRRRVLMVHRNARPGDHHLGKYNGLGGKLEADEDIVALAKKRGHRNVQMLPEQIKQCGFDGIRQGFAVRPSPFDLAAVAFHRAELAGQIMEHRIGAELRNGVGSTLEDTTSVVTAFAHHRASNVRVDWQLGMCEVSALGTVPGAVSPCLRKDGQPLGSAT